MMAVSANARNRQNFDANWRFMLADSAAMASDTYNDAHWRLLSLPHDWAREGDFLAGNPSGAGGGALPGGVGWYRKTFRVERSADERVFMEFDGVYMNSTVYVNGKSVGTRPYGYSTFEYDITPLLRQGDNVVAVRVDNSDQPNSRWYSGCGIYRHVWLTMTSDIHVAHWGVHAVADATKGTVTVTTRVDNPTGRRVQLHHALIDAEGNVVAQTKGGTTATLALGRKKMHLWDITTPYIYYVRTRVIDGGRVVDEVTSPTGFRTFRFDAATGFWLNGRNLKLNGVCEHHDFGSLGAALSEDAMHRKLLRLKEMGVNAIRSSHNPPAPELLAMCDTMGLIVMDESFDMWRRRKSSGDYARFFDKWHERDLTDLVMRDRNHPCILMWSIGNEVLEQWSSADADTLTLEQANLILNAGHDASTLAKAGEMSVNTMLCDHLASIVRRLDSTRPVTAGCNEPSPGNHLFRGKGIDVIGYNYHTEWIKDVPKNFPGRPFIMTESVSALQTTSHYLQPSDSVRIAPKEWWLPYSDPSYMCSAYDNSRVPWGSTHEDTWSVVKHTPYVGGQFIWTGFDYIGEPTPYGFPARSSYFGIVDLSGQPKDVYYMYQSEWTDRPVLHLFPHWNWLEGQELDMWCYYSQADEVELFVNGRSQGVRRKGSGAPLCTEFHVGWRVVFEPGEVSVVARRDGREVGRQTLRTAGEPHHVQLDIDYSGRDLTFVRATVVDEHGNRCPWAENQLFFSGKDVEIVATDNGCQTSMERFTSAQRRAFFGRALAVVRGEGTLSVRTYGLPETSIKIK